MARNNKDIDDYFDNSTIPYSMTDKDILNNRIREGYKKFLDLQYLKVLEALKKHDDYETDDY